MAPSASAAASEDTDAATYTGMEPPANVCAEARRLNGEGRPSDALDLIARQRSTDAAVASGAPVPPEYLPVDACREEREEALTRVERGRAFAAFAATLAASDGDEATDTAEPTSAPATTVKPCPSLTSVGVIDRDAALRFSEQCDQGSAAPMTVTKPPVALQEAWAQTRKDVVEPLGAVALPVAAVALALLIAARMVIPMVRRWPLVDRSRSTWLVVLATLTLVVAATTVVAGVMEALPGRLSVWLIVIALLTLLAATFSLALFADPTGTWASVTVAVVFGLAVIGPLLVPTTRLALSLLALPLVVLAVGLVTVEMATRLRLSISVRDSGETSKETIVGHLVALIEEMGGDTPRGLEIPRGADVTALTSSVISTDPTGALAKALWSAWQLLVAPIPWRVQVDEDSTGRLNVVMTRNGRSASAVVVSPGELLPPAATDKAAVGSSPDPYRFVAAALLITLHRYHPLRGLYGVTDWRSLGYHCVATLDLPAGTARKELLARALAAQPDNLPAQLALQVSLFRDSKEKEELDRFATWLGEFIERLGQMPLECQALLLRAHNMRVTSLVNARYAEPPPWTALADELEEPITEFGKAVEEAEGRTAPDSPQYPFVQQMRARHSWLKGAYVDQLVQVDNRTPLGAYAAACYKASVDWEPDQALTLLELADVDPDLRVWRSSDPQLQRLRRQRDYARTFPRPAQTDAFTLAPLASVRSRLARHGLEDLSVLADFWGRESDLAHLVNLPDGTARRAVAVAFLVRSLSTYLPDQATAVVGELVQLNVTDVATLSRLSPLQRLRTSRRIRDSLRESADLPDDFTFKLRAWLRSL